MKLFKKIRRKIGVLIYWAGYLICRFAVWFMGHDYKKFQEWACEK